MDVSHRGNLDEANQLVTEAMVKAYELSSSLIRPKSLYKDSLWNKDLDDKKRELRKAWNVAGRTGREEDRALHRALLKEYKQAHVDLKERCKAKFLEEADSIPAYARIHKILAKNPLAQVGSLLKPDGTYTVDGRDTAEHLLETHFPGGINPLDSQSEVQVTVSDFVPSRKDWKFAERITRKGKLKWAIFKFQLSRPVLMGSFLPYLRRVLICF